MTVARALALLHELDHLHPDRLDRTPAQRRALYRSALETAATQKLLGPKHVTALRLALRSAA